MAAADCRAFRGQVLRPRPGSRALSAPRESPTGSFVMSQDTNLINETHLWSILLRQPGAFARARLPALWRRPLYDDDAGKAGNGIVDSALSRIAAAESHNVSRASVDWPKRRLAFGFDHFRRALVFRKVSSCRSQEGCSAFARE